MHGIPSEHCIPRDNIAMHPQCSHILHTC
jgi:hypothetical protein